MNIFYFIAYFTFIMYKPAVSNRIILYWHKPPAFRLPTKHKCCRSFLICAGGSGIDLTGQQESQVLVQAFVCNDSNWNHLETWAWIQTWSLCFVPKGFPAVINQRLHKCPLSLWLCSCCSLFGFLQENLHHPHIWLVKLHVWPLLFMPVICLDLWSGGITTCE